MKMSNIANQMMAIAATLLGFVAHDALTERSAPATSVASAVQSDVDPVVTRAIDLDAISADWLNASPRAERAAQPSPAMPMSEGTAAARIDPFATETEFADVRANDMRVAPDSRMIDAGFLR